MLDVQINGLVPHLPRALSISSKSSSPWSLCPRALWLFLILSENPPFFKEQTQARAPKSPALSAQPSPHPTVTLWELLEEDADSRPGLLVRGVLSACVSAFSCCPSHTHTHTDTSSEKDFKVKQKQERRFGCRQRSLLRVPALVCVCVSSCVLQPINLLRDVFKNVG